MLSHATHGLAIVVRFHFTPLARSADFAKPGGRRSCALDGLVRVLDCAR